MESDQCTEDSGSPVHMCSDSDTVFWQAVESSRAVLFVDIGRQMRSYVVVVEIRNSVLLPFNADLRKHQLRQIHVVHVQVVSLAK